MRVIPELLRPLADYIELIFCVLVVATLTLFPDGLGLRPGDRKSRRRQLKASQAPAQTSEMHADRIAALLNATRTIDSTRPAGKPADVPMLEVVDVSKSYGALRAVDHVSMSVASGSLHGLMGPNGAGKTTLFNMISGFHPDCDGGRVLLAGAPLDAVPIERRIALGMTRTFQHAAVFQRLSCLDNVSSVSDATACGKAPCAASLPRSTPQTARAERHAAFTALDAVGLGCPCARCGRPLSLGDQRRLEIARAIVSRPRLLLLDEPVSGVSVEEAQRLRELLLAINRELGIAMVVIEHNIGFLASLCQRISVMSEGRIIAEGDAAAMVTDPRVRHAYFGEGEVAA